MWFGLPHNFSNYLNLNKLHPQSQNANGNCFNLIFYIHYKEEEKAFLQRFNSQMVFVSQSRNRMNKQFYCYLGIRENKKIVNICQCCEYNKKLYGMVIILLCSAFERNY